MIPEVVREFADVTVLQSGSSQDVILKSDVVIVVSSTTGIEACVADKNLVVLDLFDDPNAVPYAAYGAAVRIPASKGDLAAELQQIIARLRDASEMTESLREGRRRLLDDMVRGAAGDAVHRQRRPWPKCSASTRQRPDITAVASERSARFTMKTSTNTIGDQQRPEAATDQASAGAASRAGDSAFPKVLVWTWTSPFLPSGSPAILAEILNASRPGTPKRLRISIRSDAQTA